MNDYFKLLDLPEQYNLDKNKLKQNYLIQQSKFHPDQLTDSANVDFLQKSMQLNEAYKILSDDYKRAEYLLKRRNIDFSDNNPQLKLPIEDLDFFFEQNNLVMETDEISDLKQIKEKYLDKKEVIIGELEDYFNNDNLVKALDITVKLKYFINLIKNIDNKIKDANNRD